MRQVVTVGLDGSREGLAAARWTADEAGQRKLTLRLLHAWPMPAPEPAPPPRGSRPEPLGQRLVHTARAELAARHAGLSVVGNLAADDAEAALLHAASESEMLVLGSRGLDPDPAKRSAGRLPTAGSPSRTRRAGRRRRPGGSPPGWAGWPPRTGPVRARPAGAASAGGRGRPCRLPAAGELPAQPRVRAGNASLAGRPRPGDRLPDAIVSSGGAPQRLHQLLAGPGVHLLAQRDADPPPGAATGAQVTVLRLADNPGRGLVAVRPDGHVGIQCGAADPVGLLRWLTLVGAATSSHVRA